ncbi:histidine phosphatase family protein [Aureimonas jatrophae]|uniref:Broad specificity phosphatase PhoE n=1 Tax=Aureimonas jatrophae TaxID=1166073 RepID=A0A1H0IU85_9HYPH|nr:histidine phosphatase family protein [Aureimonas jatrophae]MBB3952348.1 broad specificity phosphatase PhoE [Aureimonas jatrophae]SDO34611.1 Broad specificity phosphatase PhoE [Aureimonas jatrophae]
MKGGRLVFITHPEVVIDPAVPVEAWSLSARGRERMNAFAREGDWDQLVEVWSSREPKAREGAEILAARQGLVVRSRDDLGENDRRATGFLPPDEFQRTADLFFAHPAESIRGWERAVDAQARVRRAVDAVLAEAPCEGDVAVVAHGGVGTLLLLSFLGEPISRSADQPFEGHYWTLERSSGRVLHRWRPIAPR